MPHRRQPKGAPPQAPWEHDQPTGTPAPAPAPRPGQPLPTQPPAPQGAPPHTGTMSQGGIALPPGAGQPDAPATPPGQPQEQEQAKQIEQGPWSAFACHRSWLMGGRPAVRQVQSPPVINPQTGQILDPGGKITEEVIMMPVPSPYQCIGPKCMFWDPARGGCVERLLMDAQLRQVEQEISLRSPGVAQEPIPAMVLAPDSDPEPPGIPAANHDEESAEDAEG